MAVCVLLTFPACIPLQIFPLFGYYIAATSKAVIVFATVYVMMVFAVLIEALMGMPLI